MQRKWKNIVGGREQRNEWGRCEAFYSYFPTVLRGLKSRVDDEGENESDSFKSWRSLEISSRRLNSSSKHPFNSHNMFSRVDSGSVMKCGIIVDV